jgi:hypothetical protein
MVYLWQWLLEHIGGNKRMPSPSSHWMQQRVAIATKPEAKPSSRPCGGGGEQDSCRHWTSARCSTVLTARRLERANAKVQQQFTGKSR